MKEAIERRVAFAGVMLYTPLAAANAGIAGLRIASGDLKEALISGVIAGGCALGDIYSVRQLKKTSRTHLTEEKT